MVKIFLALFLMFSFNLILSEDLLSLVRSYEQQEMVPFSDFYCRNEILNDMCTFSLFNKNKMDENLWLGPRPIANWFNIYTWARFNVYNIRFLPYIQKIILDDPYSTVAFLGDLHDNLDNLVAYLKELQRQGYLDENYKICKSNFYIVFLGDYVDRNPKYKKKEILNLLIKLYNENLGKVFMLRGNHDGCDSVRKPQEEIDKHYLWVNFFEMLPVALFMGVRGTGGITNFVQCCHGGIEPGFEVKSFLQSRANFQRILDLRRRNVCCEFVDDVCSDYFDDRYYLFKDFMITANLSLGLISLGFVWSDFEIDPSRKGLNICNERGGTFIYGKSVTKNYLKASSTFSIKLLKIIRGHQHSGKLFTASLRPNHMCSNLWNGSVYTLISFLDNMKSFMIWHTDPVVNNWKFVHYYTVDSSNNFFNKEV